MVKLDIHTRINTVCKSLPEVTDDRLYYQSMLLWGLCICCIFVVVYLLLCIFVVVLA
jgi:hypothetical protein